MSENSEIIRRLTMLRREMESAGITFYMTVSTDPHGSEYIGDHFKVTEYLSGCTSDNVHLLVGRESAWLWTDGRYFISAASELEGTGITLMKSGMDGVPTPEAFLEEHLGKEDVLGFDGLCVSAVCGNRFREAAKKKGAAIESGEDLAARIWLDRPHVSAEPIFVLPDEIAGRSAADKTADVREEMRKQGASYLVLNKLDDIMWLLNIRGGDVDNNPVAMSYALIGTDTVDLFVRKQAVSGVFSDYCRAQKIKVHPYEDILRYLSNYHFEGSVLVDRASVNDGMFRLLKECAHVISGESPVTAMKALKNPTEIENIRRFYLLDSAAVCRFIFKIRKMAGRERFTEYDAAMLLDGMRAEIPGFIELSFPTISAYQANAAMAHYSPSREDSAEVKAEGFLLVDSGGQYMGATTDVTRTIALGPLTDEMKRDFTLVAAANLNLLFARFAKGTTGGQLDYAAREVLFKHGINYGHGTGHGIGYILNVHEGPQRIGMPGQNGSDVAMQPGMVTSDEPGIYKEGRYGIRTESIVLTVPDIKNEFGEFYAFEPLTFVPIDLDAIDPQYLERADREHLNAYHEMVREKIAPLLEGEELEWLIEATRQI